MDSTVLVGVAVAVAAVALIVGLVIEVGRRPPGVKPGDVGYRWYSRLFTAFDRWRGGV